MLFLMIVETSVSEPMVIFLKFCKDILFIIKCI